MKTNIRKSRVETNTELVTGLSPDDALKLKLAVATRSLGKKEKSGLFANVIKEKIKKDIK